MSGDHALKDRVLRALLPAVPFDGWSRRSLAAAGERAELSAAELASLFPRGARDAISWFSQWADRETEKALAKKKLGSLKLRERIALGVTTRLAVLEPHREAVRRMLTALTLPLNVPLGARLLYGTVDMLWHEAGDRSTDFSFYTKRGLLAGIYATTTLVWLDDRSAGHATTKAFLDRRIADVMRIPKLRARIEGAFGAVTGPLKAMARFRSGG